MTLTEARARIMVWVLRAQGLRDRIRQAWPTENPIPMRIRWLIMWAYLALFAVIVMVGW